ncbi:hypothetical protein A3Q56_03120, partial [Intoshia linei]
NSNLESSPVSTEQADLIARKNVQKCQEKLIGNNRTKERHLTVGECVRVKRPQLKVYSMLQPLKIVEVIKPGTYKLEDSSVWNGREKENRVSLILIVIKINQNIKYGMQIFDNIEDVNNKLDSTDNLARIECIPKIINFFQECDLSCFNYNTTSFDKLLNHILVMIKNSNFKISSKSMQLLCVIILRIGLDNFRPYFNQFSSTIVDHLGHTKINCRDAAIEAIILLIKSIGNLQNSTDFIVRILNHKSCRIRENVILCLQQMLSDNFTPKNGDTIISFNLQTIISLTKLVTVICTLVSDANPNVRNASTNFLLFLFRIYDKKVISIVQRQNSGNITRLSGIINKMNEIEKTKDHTEYQNKLMQLKQTLASNDYQRPDMKLSSKNVSQSSINTTCSTKRPRTGKKLSTSSLNKLGLRSRRPVTGLRSIQHSQKSSFESIAHDDMTNFVINKFEIEFLKVNKLHFNKKQLEILLNSNQKDLARTNHNFWNERLESLVQLRSITFSVYDSENRDIACVNFMNSSLRSIALNIISTLTDNRSQLIIESTITIAYMAKMIKSKFEIVAEIMITSLISTLANVKCNADASRTCLMYVFENVCSVRLFNALVTSTDCRNPIIHKEVARFLYIILKIWPKSILSKCQHSKISDLIEKFMNDSDQEARRIGRKCFFLVKSFFIPKLTDKLYNKLDESKRKILVREESLVENDDYFIYPRLNPDLSLSKSSVLTTASKIEKSQKTILDKSFSRNASCPNSEKISTSIFTKRINSSEDQCTKISISSKVNTSINKTIDNSVVEFSASEEHPDSLNGETQYLEKLNCNVSMLSHDVNNLNLKTEFTVSAHEVEDEDDNLYESKSEEFTENMVFFGIRGGSHVERLLEFLIHNAIFFEHDLKRRHENDNGVEDFSLSSNVSDDYDVQNVEMKSLMLSINEKYDISKEDYLTNSNIELILEELSNHNKRRLHRVCSFARLLWAFERKNLSEACLNHIQPLCFILIESLSDKYMEIRIVVLLVLRVISVNHWSKISMNGHLILTKIIHVIENDDENPVITAGKLCSIIIAYKMKINKTISCLKVYINRQNYPSNKIALAILINAIKYCTESEVTEYICPLVPLILHSYNDSPISQVRKECVFCLVEIYLVIGNGLLPYIADLRQSKKKLLNIYIKRAVTNKYKSTEKTTLNHFESPLSHK